MKTFEEVAQIRGVTLKGETLNLHFNPIPNWYGYYSGFDCPRCDHNIDWRWQGNMPNFTNEVTTQHLQPITTGAKLLAFGHRWIKLECDKCHTIMLAENFD